MQMLNERRICSPDVYVVEPGPSVHQSACRANSAVESTLISTQAVYFNLKSLSQLKYLHICLILLMCQERQLSDFWEKTQKTSLR